MTTEWRDVLPEELGPLTLGRMLRRTDANGPLDAKIVILGVYPAATEWNMFSRGTVKLKLPTAVERFSFEPSSRSGGDLDRLYLGPDLLDLSRSECLMVDLMPYFFANTSKGKAGERCMWENVRLYCELTGETTAIQERPSEDELLKLCREMPGNQERLKYYLGRSTIKLLLTLGREAAAFVRGEQHGADGQQYLYSPPADVELFGVVTKVVHCVHPGNLQRKDKWKKSHAEWCRTTGRRLIREALGG